jgi:hypothetical protein
MLDGRHDPDLIRLLIGREDREDRPRSPSVPLFARLKRLWCREGAK